MVGRDGLSAKMSGSFSWSGSLEEGSRNCAARVTQEPHHGDVCGGTKAASVWDWYPMLGKLLMLWRQLKQQTTNTGRTGMEDPTPIDVRPPYYAVAIIMRKG